MLFFLDSSASFHSPLNYALFSSTFKWVVETSSRLSVAWSNLISSNDFHHNVASSSSKRKGRWSIADGRRNQYLIRLFFLALSHCDIAFNCGIVIWDSSIINKKSLDEIKLDQATDNLDLVSTTHLQVIEWEKWTAKWKNESLINKKARAENQRANLQSKIKTWAKSIFLSATPAKYELNLSDEVVEQIIRPTWLLDPITYVYPKSWDYVHLLASVDKLLKKKTIFGDISFR